MGIVINHGIGHGVLESSFVEAVTTYCEQRDRQQRMGNINIILKVSLLNSLSIR